VQETLSETEDEQKHIDYLSSFKLLKMNDDPEIKPLVRFGV